MVTAVLLTGEGREHKYVANHLASNGLLDAIVIDEGKHQSSIDKCKVLVRRHGFVGLIGRGLLRSWDYWGGPRPARAAALQKILGDKSTDFTHPEIVQRVKGINGAGCISHLKNLNPDIILVYGTSVISSRVLSLGREVTLNMHTGISPYYRGADCAFWPLYNNELHMLGATVHECTSDLDGGRVFGRTSIELNEEDDIETVFARCVVAGADLYCSVVSERVWLQPHSGEAQDLSLGREYLSTMRNFRTERSLRRRVKSGLIRDHVRQINTLSKRVEE